MSSMSALTYREACKSDIPAMARLRSAVYCKYGATELNTHWLVWDGIGVVLAP